MLKQDRNSPVRPGCQVAIIYAVTNGYLNGVEVSEVKSYESRLYQLLEEKHADLLLDIESGKWNDEILSELKKALSEMEQ